MLDSFLDRYYLSLAHIMYLFFLTLKYKKPQVFDDIFIKKTYTNNFESLYKELSKFRSIKAKSVEYALKKVSTDTILSELNESVHCTA